MGFLKHLFHPKRLIRTITSPKRLVTTTLTGGLNLVAPKLTRPLERGVGQTLFNPRLALRVASTIGPGKFLQGSGVKLPTVPRFSWEDKFPSVGLPKGKGRNMGFNFGTFLGGVGSALGGLSGASAAPVRAVGGLLSAVGSGLPPAPTIRTGASGRALAPYKGGAVMRSGAVVGRGFFNKFPNLATKIQMFRNNGISMTRKKLYSLLKRFGPDFLVSAGILTAVELSELAMAGPGTRRMNPGNVKALRRSLRRLESFHHLCMRADKLRRPRLGRKASRSAGSQQFVRQG
jgi:hypothetical protein